MLHTLDQDVAMRDGRWVSRVSAIGPVSFNRRVAIKLYPRVIFQVTVTWDSHKKLPSLVCRMGGLSTHERGARDERGSFSNEELQSVETPRVWTYHTLRRTKYAS